MAILVSVTARTTQQCVFHCRIELQVLISRSSRTYVVKELGKWETSALVFPQLSYRKHFLAMHVTPAMLKSKLLTPPTFNMYCPNNILAQNLMFYLPFTAVNVKTHLRGKISWFLNRISWPKRNIY